MSGFGQARDVLNDAIQFHQRLADKYQEMAVSSPSPRVTMLLEFLSRHERHLETMVTEFKAEASPKVLDMWFQAVHPSCSIHEMDHVTFKPQISEDEALELALCLRTCLMESYSKMIGCNEPPAIRKVFEGLLEMEQIEKEQLVRGASQIGDL